MGLRTIDEDGRGADVGYHPVHMYWASCHLEELKSAMIEKLRRHLHRFAQPTFVSANIIAGGYVLM